MLALITIFYFHSKACLLVSKQHKDTAGLFFLQVSKYGFLQVYTYEFPPNSELFPLSIFNVVSTSKMLSCSGNFTIEHVDL